MSKHLCLIFLANVAAAAVVYSSPALSQSGPTEFSLSGGLYYPNGTPITQKSVDFKIEILDPTGNCVLYQELHNDEDLSTTRGGFALQVGAGANGVNNLAGGTTLKASVFENNGITSVTGCGSINLSSGDNRLIRVSYDLGSGFVAMNPTIPMTSSAYAMVAESVQGKRAADLVQIRNDNSTYYLGQSNIEWIFNSTNWPRMQNLLNGTSSQYMVTSPSADVSFNNRKITNLASPTANTDAATKQYADGSIGGFGASLTGIGLGTGEGSTLVWDSVDNRWEIGSPNATDNTKLPLAGGTMSGAITMGGNDIANVGQIYNVGHITMQNQSLLRLGSYTSAQEGLLALGTGNAGTIFYNSDLNQLRVWNGTDYSGVAPGGTAGGDLTGSYPSPTITGDAVTSAKIADGAVTSDDIADGTITSVDIGNDQITSAKINNSGIAINRLLMTDATTGSTVTYATCAQDEILKFNSSTGWGCATAVSLIGNTGVTAGSYGSAISVGTFSVDAQGRLTNASNVAIGFPVTAVAGKTGDVSLNTADVAGLGTAAAYNVGTSADEIPALDSLARIPAVDGGLLTNVSAQRLQGRTLSSASPSDGQILVWNNTFAQWEPQTSSVASAFVQGGNSYSGIATLGTNDNYRLDFETNNTTRMSIDTSGNVGIGTSNPVAKLDLIGDVKIGSPTNNILLQPSSSTNGPSVIRFNNSNISGQGRLLFEYNGATGQQGGYSYKQQIWAFHGLTLQGARGLTTEPDFVAGSGASDTSVTVMGNGTSRALDVINGNSYFNGNVGVGTTNPLGPFSVIPTPGRMFTMAADQYANPTWFSGDANSDQTTGMNFQVGRVGTLSYDKGASLNLYGNKQGDPTGTGLAGGVVITTAQDSSITSPNGMAIIFRTGVGRPNFSESMRIDRNGVIGIGTTVLTAGAILDINGTGTAFSSMVIPRDTTALRPTVGVNGMIRYNTTTQKFEAFEGSWKDMISSASSGADITDVIAGSGLLGGATSGAATLSVQFPMAATSDGTAAAPAYSFNGDADNGMYKPSTDTLAFSTAGTQRLTLDSSGNVGIGTTSPTDRFEVVGNVALTGSLKVGSTNAAGTMLEAYNAGSNTARIYLRPAASAAYGYSYYWSRLDNNGSLTSLYAGSYQDLALGTSGENIRIKNNGNIGIGTANPTAKLEVNGATAFSSGTLAAPGITFANDLDTGIFRAADGSLGLIKDGVENARINSNGWEINQNRYYAWCNIGTGCDLYLQRSAANTMRISSDGANGNANLVVNGSVGIGTTSPTAGTILDLSGTGTAFSSVIIPRETTALRPTVGVNGMIRYNTTSQKFEAFEGSWKDMISSAASGADITDVIAGSGLLGGATSGAATLSVQFPMAATSDGTAAEPTYSFSGDTDTGMYRSGTNELAFSVQGTQRLRFDANGKSNFFADVSTENGVLYAQDLVLTTAGDFQQQDPNATSYFAGRLTVGANTVTTGARLDVVGTGTAFSSMIIPRDSTALRPTVGVNGMIRYNTTTQKFEAFEGSWKDMISTASSGADITDVIAGNGLLGGASSGAATLSVQFPMAATSDGTAAAPAYSFSGDTDNGMFKPSTNFLAFSSAGTQRLSIDSNGNVGVGTTSPIFTFEVAGEGSMATLGNSVYSNTASDAAGFIGRKARGTKASPAAVQTDDIVGGFYGGGYTSAGVFGVNSGRFGIHAAENYTSSAQGSYMTFSVTPVGSVVRGEAMRITSGGNVGIGTTSPSTKLHIVNSDESIRLSSTNGVGSYLHIDNSNNKRSYIGQAIPGAGTYGTSNNGLWLGAVDGASGSSATNLIKISTADTDRIAFVTASQKRMVIDNAGNVGIGIDSPTAKLHVNGSILADDIRPTSAATSLQTGSGMTFQRRWSMSLTADSLRELGQWGDTEGTVQLLVAVSSETSGNSGTNLYLIQAGYAKYSASWQNVVPMAEGLGHGDSTSGYNLLVASNGGYAYKLAVGVPAGKAAKSLQVTVTELKGGMSFTDNSATAAVAYSSAGDVYSYNKLLVGGSVGIGTATPSSLLTVGDGVSAARGITVTAGGTPYIELLRPGQSHWKFQHTNNGLAIQNSWSGAGYNSAIAMDDGLGIGTTPVLSLKYAASGGYRVGVNNTSPATNFSVTGSADFSGNVGIGTTSPSSKLEVTGTSEWPIRLTFDSATATNRTHFLALRSRAGGAVSSGDTLGGLGMGGKYDATNYALGWNGGAEITGWATENWSSTARGTALAFSTTPNTTIVATERVRIAQNGNVGIGTTTPAETLEVSGNILLSRGGNRTISVGTPTSTGIVGHTLALQAGAAFDGGGGGSPTDGGPLHLAGGRGYGTGGANRGGTVFIYGGEGTGSGGTHGNVILAHTGTVSRGNVGIGTTSPSSALHLYNANPSDGLSQPLVLQTNSGFSNLVMQSAQSNHALGMHFGMNAPSTGNDLRWGKLSKNTFAWISNPMILNLDTGNLSITGTLSQSSDLRLKTEIQPIENPLRKLSSLNGVTYLWKDHEKGTDRQMGLIAQEVEKVFPEAVRSDQDGWKSIAYQNLIAPLIEAIKALYAKDTVIDSRLEKLEQENRALRQSNEALKAWACQKDPSASFCQH